MTYKYSGVSIHLEITGIDLLMFFSLVLALRWVHGWFASAAPPIAS